MAEVSPETIRANRQSLGVPDERIPRSIAIIMDGNGRWARAHDMPRSAGHYEGAKIVSDIITQTACLGLEALSMYSFSIENWSRPKDEINSLMHLYALVLRRERKTMMDHNIRLRHLGRRDGLPDSVLRELDESARVSRDNTGMILCLALNYASRAEMTDAMVRIARRVAAGELDPIEIDESVITQSLDTAGVPDPDLLIRTSGEMRLSNYLLWQISYSELYVTDVHWPDFKADELKKAIVAYASRNRRFGGIDNSNT